MAQNNSPDATQQADVKGEGAAAVSVDHASSPATPSELSFSWCIDNGAGPAPPAAARLSDADGSPFTSRIGSLEQWLEATSFAAEDDENEEVASSAAEVATRYRCVFCRQAGRSVVLLPCRHLAYCRACSARARTTFAGRFCPIDRQLVLEHMELFL
jgi:hypothetical protein